MYIDKNKITLTVPQDEKIILENGGVIFVKPFLDISDMVILSNIYMDEFFKDGVNHVIQAESKLILGLLDLCTSIELTDDFSFRLLMANSKVLDSIKAKIKNYGEFRAWLRVTIDERKEKNRLAMSTGSQLSYLMSYLKNLEDVSVSSQDVENAKQIAAILNESPLGAAIKKME